MIFIILLIKFNSSYSQNDGVDNVIGKTYTLVSEALNESREINIYVPEGYDNSEKQYPVLYVLDGQKFFLYGVSLQRLFAFRKYSPDFIVVGITSAYPHRFGHYDAGATDFLDFIQHDVIEFVDKNFRTSKTRFLFGWEYAGALTIQAMTDLPQLFTAFIAASPFPVILDHSSLQHNRLGQLENLLVKDHNFDRFFYFSVSENEGMVEEGTEDLNLMLKTKAPQTMDWFYKILVDEDHTSTPFATLYQGLTHFYHYYPELQFKTLQEYHRAGGMKYVLDYHKQRSEKYGFSSELSNWTKFTLIRNALRVDDFKQFEVFMKAFSSQSFIETLRGRRPYEIAKFYEKNKSYTKAIEIYKILMNKNPTQTQPLKSLGNVYTLLNDKTMADEYHAKADKLNQSNNRK